MSNQRKTLGLRAHSRSEHEWMQQHGIAPEAAPAEAERPELELQDGEVACVFERSAAVPLHGHSRRAVVTLADASVESWLVGFLNSLRQNGKIGAARVVVMHHESYDCRALLERYGAVGLPFRELRRVENTMEGYALSHDWTVKGMAYGVTDFIDAEEIVFIDCDTLILGSLSPLWSAMEVIDRVLICMEGNGYNSYFGGDLRRLTLLQWARQLYRADAADMEALWPGAAGIAAVSHLNVNSGVFAGRREALKSVAQTLRAMLPQSWEFIAEMTDLPREQMLHNLALAICGAVEMEAVFNCQVHLHEVEVRGDQVSYSGRSVRVLHFPGSAKNKFPELRARFSKVL